MSLNAGLRTRRQFLGAGTALAVAGLLAGCGLPSPLAPAPKRLPRLGFLSSTARPSTLDGLPFLQALAELGYVDGETITIELRWADEQETRLAALAAELVALDVDVIYGWNTLASRAAKRATSTVPIVFAPSNDPIGAGLVTNLARPDSNATGLKLNDLGLNAKRLDLLRETLPGHRRVAVLGHAAGLLTAKDWAETLAAGRTLSLDLRRYDVQTVDDFDGVFGTIAKDGADAIFTLGDSFFARNAAQIVGLAAQHRLPGMHEHRVYPATGGLLSYGPNVADGHRRAATYVDKILRGAKPADLPVEQPTSFDFIVNQKCARTLGVTIPQTILQQATQIIDEDTISGRSTS